MHSQHESATNYVYSDKPVNQLATASSTVTQPADIHCELLCFAVDKLKTMAVDHVLKLCLDFYREDEIMAAKGHLDQVAKTRIPKRQGPNKLRFTMEDILKNMCGPQHHKAAILCCEYIKIATGRC